MLPATGRLELVQRPCNYSEVVATASQMASILTTASPDKFSLAQTTPRLFLRQSENQPNCLLTLEHNSNHRANSAAKYEQSRRRLMRPKRCLLCSTALSKLPGDGFLERTMARLRPEHLKLTQCLSWAHPNHPASFVTSKFE